MSDEFNGNGYSPGGGEHLVALAATRFLDKLTACQRCGGKTPDRAKYCPECGYFVEADRAAGVQLVNDLITAIIANPEKIIIESPEGDCYSFPTLTKEQARAKFEYVFPVSGVYIYFHPYEKYKIGKGEKIVQRRIPTHQTTAPSLRLLHVIETSDLDWCEKFLHDKFRHRRIWANHEYFDLTEEDLDWLFRIKVMEPPRSNVDQLRLLDLL